MMIFILLFFFIYSNADSILNNYYFSKFINLQNTELIDNPYFSSTITYVFTFTLNIYLFFIIKHIIYYSSFEKNKYSIALALVYTKFTMNVLLNDRLTLQYYECTRNIMWLFTTPLMLKMYCIVNRLKLKDIKIHYHLIPTFLNIFIYPYKKTIFYYYFLLFSYLSLFLFIKNLYKKRDLIFTNIYIFIWLMFGFINLLDLFQILNKHDVNIYYAFADMISKLITNIIISDHNEKEITMTNNMDLQCLQFSSYMVKHIKKYEKDNAVITKNCIHLIELAKQRFLSRIPENNILLEQELLHFFTFQTPT